MAGTRRVNVLPRPRSLVAVIWPPSSALTWLAIDSPSPVPPYRRLSVPSPCWNAPKMTARFSGAMPIPVSTTENTSSGSPPRPSAAGVALTRSVTRPRSVNLTALESRFPTTWRRRCRSVSSSASADGSIATSKSRPFSVVSGWKVACRSSIGRPA